MKIDLTNAPRVSALVSKHEAETAALPMNPDTFTLLQHAQRQVLELLQLAAALERGE